MPGTVCPRKTRFPGLERGYPTVKDLRAAFVKTDKMALNRNPMKGLGKKNEPKNPRVRTDS